MVYKSRFLEKMKLSIFILLILSLIPSFLFSAEKDKTFYLICEGKSIYEIDDRNVKESKTYELRWNSHFYKLYHENEILSCFHTKTKIECGRYSGDDKFNVEIDRINGAVEQWKILEANSKFLKSNNHFFRGFCKIKDKTLF